MIRENKAFIVNHEFEKKCYICGRDSAQVKAVIDIKDIGSHIQQNVNNENKKVLIEIDDYIKLLKNLYKETESYQQNLTKSELKENPKLADKIAPKFRELLKLCNQEKHDYSIAELRAELQSLIADIQNKNYTKLSQCNPILASRVKDINLYDYNNFNLHIYYLEKKEEIRAFKLDGTEVEREYRQIYDDDRQTYLDEYYWDYIETKKGYDNKKVEIPANKIIEVHFIYYICTICSRLFEEASDAAYEILQDNDSDD